MPYLGSLSVLVIENGETQYDILTSTQDLLELPTPYYSFDIFIIDSVFSPFFGKTVRLNGFLETFVLNSHTMREHILPHLAAKYRNGYENREAHTQYQLEWLKLYPSSQCANKTKTKENSHTVAVTAMFSPHAQKRMRLNALLDKIIYYSENQLWYSASTNVTQMTNIKPSYIEYIYQQILILNTLDENSEHAEIILNNTYEKIQAQLQFTIIPTCKNGNITFCIDALRDLDSLM